jgi:hypothetical protein
MILQTLVLTVRGMVIVTLAGLMLLVANLLAILEKVFTKDFN